MRKHKNTYSRHLAFLLTASFAYSTASFAAIAAAAEKVVDLQVGDKAPHFVGTDDENNEWDSETALKLIESLQ